jgi:hypothetical protein
MKHQNNANPLRQIAKPAIRARRCDGGDAGSE